MQDPSSMAFQGIKPQFPEQEQHLKCPRCDSTNTKFCYYNNYNLSQPRHFCKSCRRYWTKGGALRNIPVGGGTRKNSKRSNTSGETKENNNCKRSAPSSVVLPKMESLPVGYQHVNDQILDGSGSFSSLLGSSVHLGGLLGSIPNSSDLTGRVQNGEENSGSVAAENFLGLQGDSGNGWPDLSIYTPGSNFPCD